ncbi:MAG: hypothetical protein GX597_09660 [Anaerolineaceae bacterium]|nr:hypothetical protein [Anaerolineaceae bacterium]
MVETQPASRYSPSPGGESRRPAVRVEGLALVAILLLGFGLRIVGLGAGSLWYDETVSVHLAGKALPALVAHTARDIHPPGYYLLLHPWLRAAGDSEFAAAYFSLFFGLLLVALAHRLGRRVYGQGAGLWAALLVALSPYNLWYSQEVRMYTMGAALVAGLILATLALLRWERGPVPWWRLAVYALLGSAALWTLYYSAFFLVALNLMVAAWWLARGRRRPAGRRWAVAWLLAQVGALLLYAPWLPVAWRQATQPPVPPWRGFTPLEQVLSETWTALSLGQSADPALAWPAALLFALLVALGLVRRGARLRACLLAGSALLPVLLIYLASLATPLYHVRYAFTYSTAFYVVAGGGLALLWRRGRPVAWLSLALVAVLSLASIYAYHTDPRYAPDDHRAAVRFLAEAWRPGDVVLVDAGYAYTALLTYWPDDPAPRVARLVDGDEAASGGDAGGPAVLLAGSVGGSPSLGWGDPRSDFYAMGKDETAAALVELFAGHHRLWLYRVYDTVTDPDGFIRSWLKAHGRPFEDRVFSGESNLRVQGYLTSRDPLVGAEERDAALADGSLALAGSTPLPAAVEVGGALDLALTWRVGEAPPTDALLFAGLFDADGGRWAQVDERPAGTLYPAGEWQPGSLVRTPLRILIPAGTPPGGYAVVVGWYRFQDGQPIWLPWAQGDTLPLGEVEVVAPATGWASLPLPAAAQRAGVDVGDGVRLLGFDAPRLEGRPGDELPFVLYWQARKDGPQAGPLVLQLARDDGRVVAEQVAVPAGGRAPFVGLQGGQVVRDPQTLTLPAGAQSGVYNVLLGRRGPDGSLLPVRRGPVPLGRIYPLATVHVQGRPGE